MFPAYVENPHNCRFEGQDVDEKILLLLRAHPITNLQWIVPVILIFLFPLFLPFALGLFGLTIDIIPAEFRLVFWLFNFLLGLVIALEGFLYWYFNVYIVTSKNIVDIDFHSILYKNISAAPLRNIEDVSSSMKGIANSIFNFGDVLIQTAGTSENIDFISVPNPNIIADFILDEVHKVHGHRGGPNGSP